MSEDDRLKWETRYAKGGHLSTQPSEFLVALDDVLPRRGRAIDLAGGGGRNGLWLAERGLDVTIADISEMALGVARERAAERGVEVATRGVDLEADGLPAGPWDLIVSVYYLERSLWPQLPAALVPGGLFVMIQPTVTNLERHDKPPRPFLLERGELARAMTPLLSIERLDECWGDDGYHEARLVARRPE